MFTKLVLLLAIAGYTYGQSCLSIVGPCIASQCPTGGSCLSGVCCITDPAQNCNDTQDWCPAHAAACDDSSAGAQMKVTCPYTCKSCDSSSSTNTSSPGTSTPSGTVCADKVNPSTGVSDCPADKYLCNDANYKTLMQEQCPLTCGYCTASSSSPASSGTPTSTACADKVNPSTGVSDCPADKYLCNDANYKTLMQDQCPKTCGYC